MHAGPAATPRAADATLRMLNGLLADADAPADVRGRFLAAVQTHTLGGCDGLDHLDHLDHLDQLEPSAAGQVAELVVEPRDRRRALSLAVVAVLVAPEVRPRALASLRALASAFDAPHDRDVALVEDLAGGRVGSIVRSLRRRFFVTERVKLEYRQRGLRAVIQMARRQLRGESEVRARRLRGLRFHAEGTLGRAYWCFMRKHDFAFPGEPGALPEVSLFHDVNHVLTGYGTDVAGEIQMSAFHAGYRKSDPMALLLLPLMQFHHGVKVLSFTDAEVGRVDPEALFCAHARGARVNCDLTTEWDPEGDFDVSCDALRARFGIEQVVAAASVLDARGDVLEGDPVLDALVA
jgi:hypothetical protein